MTGRLDFRTPISFGWGISDSIGDLVSMDKTILVLGRNEERNRYFREKVESSLGLDVEVISGVEPNPTEETVMNGADVVSSIDPDQIIAMGGGSVMDAAKIMALIGKHGGTPLEYGTGKIVPPDGGYPVYGIPTTPGTSSEITPFAVVSIDEVSNKVGIRHPSLYPKGAIIDPELTVSLPKQQTAATGFDILSHAIESYWSIRSDPLSRQLSLRAVSLVHDHLKGAYYDGKNRDHREGVSLASVFAGMAFSNTGTTICHSISYPITYDSGLPHGIAVALTLGATFELLVEKNSPGMEDLAGALGTDVSGFRDELDRMLVSVNVPYRISESGFNGGIERILSTDMSSLMRNMPVKIDEKDLESIIQRSY